MKKVTKTILIGLDAMVAPLIEQFLIENQMPNLKRLINKGASTRIRANFPGITPVSWATIATGAYPGTHGITDLNVLDPGASFDESRSGFLSSTCQAETIWMAACREGYHAATLNFPGAEKSLHANHLWIGGRGSPSAQMDYAISHSNCYATEPYQSQLRDSIPLKLINDRIELQLKPSSLNGDGLRLRLIIETGSSSFKGVRVFHKGKEITFLRHQQPSPWLWAEFEVAGKKKLGSFRLELTHFNDRLPSIAVYVSPITCPADICSKPALGKKLVNGLGAFLGYCGARGVDRNWCPPQRMIDEGRYEAIWLARAARRLITNGYDLVMLKWHLLDHVQHSFWGGMDPQSPFLNQNLSEFFPILSSRAMLLLMK